MDDDAAFSSSGLLGDEGSTVVFRVVVLTPPSWLCGPKTGDVASDVVVLHEDSPKSSSGTDVAAVLLSSSSSIEDCGSTGKSAGEGGSIKVAMVVVFCTLALCSKGFQRWLVFGGLQLGFLPC